MQARYKIVFVYIGVAFFGVMFGQFNSIKKHGINHEKTYVPIWGNAERQSLK